MQRRIWRKSAAGLASISQIAALDDLNGEILSKKLKWKD